MALTANEKGTHGAMPHTGSDALLVICQFGVSVQTVRYGVASPIQPTMVFIGSIHSSTASNVTFEKAVLAGTFRSTSLASA